MEIITENKISPIEVTFKNSMSMPFQRWYSYIEGYSVTFVQKLISDFCDCPSLIYEPFAGTGSTLFAADSMGCDTIFSEVNPLLRFLISIKLTTMGMGHSERKMLADQLRDISESIISHSLALSPSDELAKTYHNVFGSSQYFPEAELDLVLRLRTYIQQVRIYDGLLADLIMVAILACLLPISYLKKQGDVRFRTEQERSNIPRTENILPQKLQEIASDLMAFEYFTCQSHQLITPNAKNIGKVQSQKISDVITSPPYLNGTNYFRNTKLELWYLGCLKDKQSLRAYRNEALTSGINDVLLKASETPYIYHSPLLETTLSELKVQAYDSRIPQMARCYFNEMSELFGGLRKHLCADANLLIDIGDSIFSGVHIKTDDILVEVLESLGYTFNEKILLRQRRSRCGGQLAQVLLSFKHRQ
ncbi:MAG: hypothetical protein J1E37_07485 [Prevotella sp.]|nr:hypothetical protein [Prevotella sp.]